MTDERAQSPTSVRDRPGSRPGRRSVAPRGHLGIGSAPLSPDPAVDRDLLGITGLTVAILGLAAALPGLEAERREWVQYLALGTLLPAVVLALALARTLGPRTRTIAAALTATLATAAAILALAFVAAEFRPTLAILAVAQWGAQSRCLRMSRSESPRPTARAVLRHALDLLVIAAAWLIAARLCYWGTFSRWAVRSPGSIAVLAASLGLTVAGVFGQAGPGRGRSRIAAGLAMALLLLASCRLDSLGVGEPIENVGQPGMPKGRFALFHWGPIAGPAELVRQGGWPLWDVPCQYGFLNTLVVAALPFGSVWHSLYVVHVAANFAVAAGLFLAFRSLRPGGIQAGFALALALTATFFVTGDTHDLTGPWIGPAIGAYRFVWGYVLLAILGWEFRRDLSHETHGRTLVAGCVAWLVGTLWSAESAAYCLATWGPAYLLLVGRRAWSFREHTRDRLRFAAAWLALPVGLLAATVGGITAVYQARIGHPPDWPAFVEYAHANIDGNSAPMNPTGSAWVLVLVLIALSAVASRCLVNRRPAALALIAGAWGFHWSAGSYFVARSQDILVNSLLPIAVAGIAAALWALGRAEAGDRGAIRVRSCLVPVLTVILTLGFANFGSLRGWARAGYVASVDRLMPRIDPELQGLLERAGIRHDDPIAYVDRSNFQLPMPAWPRLDDAGRPSPSPWPHRTWLPTLPMILFHPLPADRWAVYMGRFADRSRASGWLIEPKSYPPNFRAEVFLDALRRTHRPVETFESDAWRLTRYEHARPVAREPEKESRR